MGVFGSAEVGVWEVGGGSFTGRASIEGTAAYTLIRTNLDKLATAVST